MNRLIFVKPFDLFKSFFEKLLLKLHRFKLGFPKTTVDIGKGLQYLKNLFVDFLLINYGKGVCFLAEFMIFFENL